MKPECDEDEDCATYEACKEGVCTNVCRLDPCGYNAVCTGVNHRSQCECADGFIGTPREYCRRSEYNYIYLFLLILHTYMQEFEV